MNNTRELRRQIAGLLGKSEMWIVLRSDETGVHLHTPNEDHLSLLAVFLYAHPEIHKGVNEIISEFNTNMNQY